MEGYKVKVARVKNIDHKPHQFLITTDKGTYFQSYDTLICFRPFLGENSKIKVYLDPKWDYSQTTGKYRSIFLGEEKAITLHKIEIGKYKITNLN